MVDNKGIHIILEAVEYLRASGFTDFVVEINGDNLRYASGGRRAAIEAFFDREALRPLQERNVVMNGSYHVSQLASRMARIDWCLVPSVWWESFGLVISEAWMFRKPVICSNVGSMAERVSHEVDGLHFEIGSEAGLAEALRRAVTEAGLWERLAANIPQPPRRDDMVKGFRALYDAEQPVTMAEITSPHRSGRAASRGRHFPD